MSFEPRDYLHPILVEADYLLAARCDLTFEAFSANENLQRACVRSLEIIGEEAKKVPDDFRVEHPEVERRAMAGMRDCLIHDYFAIDFDAVNIEHGDTSNSAFGMGTYGSRSGAVGMSAIVKALDKVEAKVKKGAIWLDLRDSAEYDESHLEGAINSPFESLRYQTASLAPDRHYVVYSDTGARAMAGAFLLTERGFDVSVLEGGLQQPQVPTVVEEAAGDESGVEENVTPLVDEAAAAAMQQRVSEAEYRAQQLAAQLEEAQRDQDSASADRELPHPAGSAGTPPMIRTVLATS